MTVNKMLVSSINDKPLAVSECYFGFNPVKALISLSLLFVLVFIAVFVRDTFIRPILGDVLVVVWLYYLLASFLILRPWTIILMTLSIAFSVEFAQYIKVPKLLGIEPGSVIGTIMGATFDWLDLIAYITGAVLCMVIERVFSRKVTFKTCR